MPNKITILDGGMGRLLEKMGAPFRQPEWSALALIEASEFVKQAHQAFIDAGAQIITTNTYALVPFHIGQDKFDKEGRELIKLAGKIAREVAGENIKVAGSLPPAFGSYRPDLFDKNNAKTIYLPLIEEQEPYIDIWLPETMSSITEVETLAHLLKESNKPFWPSYNVLDREGKNEPSRLRSGETIQESVDAAISLGAKAILFNCCQVEEVEPTLEIVSNMNIDVPYGAFANAFPSIKEGEIANDEITKIREDVTPATYLETAQKWTNLGATIIGGCCGIEPAHIQELSKLNQH